MEDSLTGRALEQVCEAFTGSVPQGTLTVECPVGEVTVQLQSMEVLVGEASIPTASIPRPLLESLRTALRTRLMALSEALGRVDDELDRR